MANPEHQKIFRQGVSVWNKWRTENRGILPDLSHVRAPSDVFEADLTPDVLDIPRRRQRHKGMNLEAVSFQGANLAFLNLDGANLSNCNLNRADLHAASFNGADLTGADLSESDCRSAHFQNANLTEADFGAAELSLTNFYKANFCHAKLGHANIRKAYLAGANFEGAHVGSTTFSALNLDGVLGLENVCHDGPSHLAIDTIFLSGGSIPNGFLRGCGVPEEFIDYVRSLVGRPIEFYSCFISHSTKDKEFADRLYADLQGAGVSCWFAPHDMKAGRKIHEQIDDAIRVHDKVLLILSESSMASEWVKTEIAKARKFEIREENRRLFPVRLVPFDVLRDWECFDADSGKDSAREIREFYVPDFTNWKQHDSYQKEFLRLVNDLKAANT